MICAWRETCRKRFSISPTMALSCPDFTRDVSVKDAKFDENQPKEKDNKIILIDQCTPNFGYFNLDNIYKEE